MRFQRRWFLRLAAASALVSAMPRIAGAQTYPDRSVRMVVPYAPGGPTVASLTFSTSRARGKGVG